MVLLVVLVLIGLVSLIFFYKVDGTRDICIITTFGEITKVVDGREESGIHPRWPWPIQKVIRYDFREQVLETALSQFTIDDNDINITAKCFCTWKICDPERFHESKRKTSTEEVRNAVRSQLTSDMKSVMGSKRMDQLVNSNPEVMKKVASIEQEMATRLNAALPERFGLKVTSVGIHCINVPKSVSSGIISSQKEERKRMADQYRSEGEAIAADIKGRAEAARDKILALARGRAAEIRSQGEQAAAREYARFQEDPEFAVFLRSIEALRKGLKGNCVYILDSNSMPILSRFWNSESKSD